MAGNHLDEDAGRAARTYSAAADHYFLSALSFWDRFGEETVSRLGLSPGDTVLDLCCGGGASAIPAARAVTPGGRVLGVDVAAPLLEAARSRAAGTGLSNVEFRLGDARSTGLDSGSCDAVICVFGVFFAADMPAFTAEMWRLVRPGGKLALTTWGPDWCEPASSVFWEAVREIEPSLYRAFNPWDEITTPARLSRLFRDAGTAPPVIEAGRATHELSRPQDFWDIVLGSGYRGTVDKLAPGQQRILRDRVLDELRERGIRIVRTDVLYGIAERA